MNVLINRETKFIDLGLIDYKEAWDYQTNLFNKTLAVKAENRTRPATEKTENFLIFCEHPHVFTLGKSGDEKNLLVKPEDLKTIDAAYYPINRGGDITYHGPGQIVVYPVIDLENFFTDIHKYMRLLEESVILTLRTYHIDADRIPGLTGVWIGKENDPRKICALGVKTSRWVAMHGLAFNVNVNLKYFDYIVPCGINDKGVTSMEKELGASQSLSDIKQHLKKNIASLFDMDIKE